MAVSPTISKSSFAGLTLTAALLGACGGQGAVPKQPAPVEVSQNERGVTRADCAARITRGHALFEAGKLWSATRALEGCADDTQAVSVLVRAHLGLGELGEASRLLDGMPERDADLDRSLREAQRVHAARKPVGNASLDSELGAIRDSLARRQCAEASERARRSFERWRPNPKALLLEAAAAACKNHIALANRLYARAAAELQASAGLNWVQPEVKDVAGFSAPNEVVLQLEDGVAILRLASPSNEAATITPLEQPPQRHVWQDAEVEVVKRAGSLTGLAVGTHQKLWNHELPDGVYDIAPAFSAGELLVVQHDLDRWRSLWQRLDSRTGKVVSQGTFPDRYSEVMASTNAAWFAATAMTQEQQPHLMHLVFGSRRSKQIDLKTLYPCSPETVLSSSELLLICPGELRALSVDTLRQRSLARFPADFSAGDAVRGPGNWWALRGSTGLALAKLAPDGAHFSLTIAPELEGHQFLSVDWSPDGRTLAGKVVRKEGRHGAVLWDLQSARTLREFWHQPDNQFPDAALSAAGDELVMGGCSELGRLHLDSGRFEMVQLPTPACAGFTVAPTTGVLRLAARGNGSGVFWPENGALRPITLGSRVDEVQAAGPWLAANTSAGGRLLLPAADRVLELPSGTRVLALSPDGSYAVLRQVVPGSHYDILLVRLNEQSLSSHEVWRLPKSEYRYAAFTPDNQKLALWSATVAAHLDLEDLRLTGADARWPDRGARLLDQSAGLFGGRTGLLAGHALIPLDAWRPGETQVSLDLQFGKGVAPPSTFPLLGLSRDNLWIVGPIQGGAAIWRAPRGELVAQIQHSPSGGWFVTAAAGADKQQSLVQPLGTERLPLWCRSGDELYEWRVCQDRFEEPTLLKTLLTGRSE